MPGHGVDGHILWRTHHWSNRRYASGSPGKMRGRTWLGGSWGTLTSFEGLLGLFLGQQFQKHLPFCRVGRFGKPLPKQLEVLFMNELLHGYPDQLGNL
jgi:hypothetical protein